MLVIEFVAEQGHGAVAGLQREDLLLSYREHPLSSPSTLLALEENTFAPVTVVLEIERDETHLTLRAPIGKLGIETRPLLSPDLLSGYVAGRQAFQQQEFPEAARHWEEAAQQAPEIEAACWLWMQAGEAWEKQSEWAGAISAYEAAWSRLETSADTAMHSQVATALGRCHKSRSDWERAILWFERSGRLDESCQREMWQAQSLNHLGLVALSRGDLAQAQDYHYRALQIKERLAPHSLEVAKSLNGLGNVAWFRGDLAQAQDYHHQALQIKERLAPHSLTVAQSLNNLGLVASDRGDLAQAQDYFRRALQIKERLAPHSLEVAASLEALGHTFCASQQAELARLPLERAIDIVERLRSQITSPEARALLIAQHTDKYAALVECLLRLHQIQAAFTTLERFRVRSLLELLAERRLDFAAEAPGDLIRQQQELDRRRAKTYDQLGKLSLAPAEDQAPVDTLHRQLRDLERQQQELTAQIRTASPHYARLQYPQPLDCRQAQSLLDEGTLLLSYLVAEKQTFLFALTRHSVRAFALPLERKALQERVQAFRSLLDLTAARNRTSQAISQAQQQARQLYTDLMGLADRLVQQADRLLLCPDGPLHLLPWSALALPERPKTPRYLGLARPLSSTLSMTLLAQTRAEACRVQDSASAAAEVANVPHAEPTTPASEPTMAPPQPGRLARTWDGLQCLFALGDPAYPPLATAPGGGGRSPELDVSDLGQWQTRGLKLNPLPHSREEVQHIAQLFPRQTILKLGKQATKAAVLQEGAQAQVLHLACHGWLDARQPLSSGLVLAQPASPDDPADPLDQETVSTDNGLLQAWEVFSHLKLNAELVVLSACQSGLGEEVRGEGLVGLTRAFTYAGARSVLVSLWKVEDASTCEWMAAFYAGLKSGLSKAEAMQGAMQTLSRKARYRHPFFWAPFLLLGE